MSLLGKYLGIESDKGYKLTFNGDTELFIDHANKFSDIKSGDVLFLLWSNKATIDIVFNWEQVAINRSLNTTYLLEWLNEDGVSELTLEEIEWIRAKVKELS